ncbi:MAG: PEP-CTERM sorting domain-containing protein [Pirellulales bacterium]
MKCTIRTLAIVAVGLLTFALQMSTAHAAVIFSDSFDRDNNNDIDAVTTGITNNTGTSFAASAVYNSPWIDPNNAAGTDTNATNGGLQRVKNNMLEKYNAGTVNMFVEHNFVNPEITAAGGFSVSLDVNGISQATSGQGATVAIGMSRTEALSGRDANDGGAAAAITPIAKFTNAFQDAPFTTGTVLADFYFAMRADKTVAWGVGGTQPSVAAPSKATVAAKTGTIKATFSFPDFNAGSPVNYTVYYNGVAQGSGSFAWSGTNENYIGIDARDSTLVQMDNFNIQTVPEPTTFGLIAMTLACAAGFRRPGRDVASK